MVWAGLVDPSSKRGYSIAVGLDVAPSTEYASVAIASRRSDGLIHVELIAHRPGTDGLAAWLAGVQREHRPTMIMYDPASPAGSLRLELAASGVAASGVAASPVETRGYTQAAGLFYDEVMAGKVRHLDQPPLNSAVSSARWRNLGDARAWVRRQGDVDISPLVACTLAHWAFGLSGEGSAQIL